MVEGPLIQKYLKALEENPRSRVFAPLAESYRRLGMVDRAIDIIKDGMRYHPNYAVGYLSLAACYFDLEQFQLCYSTLKPFVPTSRDNLRLQRLFAESCEHIGHDHEALETYKFLLFLNPKDKNAAAKVSMLEQKDEAASRPSLRTSKAELFPVEDIRPNDALEEVSWVEVNFHKNAPDEEVEAEQDWQMHMPKSETAPKESGERASEREYIVSAATIEEEQKPVEEQKAEHVPLITHTLVDLYCNQGHFERAEEILLKMLALNPKDGPTLEKLQTVRLLLREAGVSETGPVLEQEQDQESEEELSSAPHDSEGHEDDGHNKLMQIFDSRVTNKVDHTERVRNLNTFLDRIRSRAQERHDPTTRS